MKKAALQNKLFQGNNIRLCNFVIAEGPAVLLWLSWCRNPAKAVTPANITKLVSSEPAINGDKQSYTLFPIWSLLFVDQMGTS